jgi:putative membrane protein
MAKHRLHGLFMNVPSDLVKPIKKTVKLIVHILLTAVAVVIGAYLLPGVQVRTFFDAILVAIAVSLINTFIKPVLVVLTIPITFFTLGLFLFVIDAILILLAGNLIPGFKVDGFWPALLFSIILSILSWILLGKKR